ncbi:MAG: alpha/beta fold hydrolase [Sandaracinaceae bacterium]|nr:alpha/beta fold hydrolase [Sandaracinaceae bacterium]
MPAVTLEDGTTLAYEEVGRGPAVLLIQGVGIAGCGWRPQVEALADRCRVVTFDNRGIGGTPLVGALSIERMAGDARALMDALGIERAHVVGHSMGGVIAQALALAAPTRVASLALLCTVARGKDATAMTPDIVWLGLRGKIGTVRSRRMAFLELVSSREVLAGDREAHAAALEAAFGRALHAVPPVAMKQLRALARYDASPRLAELASRPVLVVSGSEDRVTRPRFGRALAEGIAGARYVELAAAGHAAPVQQASRVNALLAEHLAGA